MKGNLDYKVGTKAADEVGELSRAFDRMTANLKKSRDELEAYSKGLEERVEHRTKELADKVKESEELRHASLNLLEDVNEAKNELEMAKKELQKTNRKLKVSNRELQDFVYVASHDLQEPIRKVSAFGQLLRDSLQGKLNEDEQENFAFMIDGASRMQQMIRDLLMYSRVSTKVKPAERVDLNEVIEDLRNIELAIQLEETAGTIHVPEPLLAVQADPSQMHQLLQNLVGNGLKYQRNGRRPEIVVRSSQEDDNTVRVEVEDNGIGIAEGNYDKIFVMFRRLHSLEEYEGTGIGLAVCKKIVDRHGGNIGVNSTMGGGSTFWFTLPAGG
ncbi:MAG: HAMP domain-containing protein [Deltaproteobacteria bacterium]|nr:HAMP domain-containing protein [Deltaproteobacteria bacterium]MBW1794009.1 HAMP domain-containing protein [Deltaproteobacteria bacterium]MBW2331053.1 HAMP domain-containing protein [Deltaproteobacteria bacterium]